MIKAEDENVKIDNAKKDAMLQAAITEFAKGYQHASTDAIVQSAGVSKGLLFHYFGTKKELFAATYDYALSAMLTEFYDAVDVEQTDILERCREITTIKFDLIQRYPSIFSFLTAASVPDSTEIDEIVSKTKKKYSRKAYSDLFTNIDRSLFKDGINADDAIRIIFFTMEGYTQSHASPTKKAEEYYKEREQYLKEVDTYIQFFRANFYK